METCENPGLYSLISDPKHLNFRIVEVTKRDETKPHPNPALFKPDEGEIEGELNKESEKAWFDTAMLEG